MVLNNVFKGRRESIHVFGSADTLQTRGPLPLRSVIQAQAILVPQPPLEQGVRLVPPVVSRPGIPEEVAAQ
jgi:hypothetical protein